MLRWLLPDHFSDVLPPEARAIESARTRALGMLIRYGYELVQPPLIEYLDALTVGAGKNLATEMFHLPDVSSGKILSLRADITTQVARIDAHILNRKGITRLCYVGSVLRRAPTHLQGTCEPIQLGAELYGYDGLAADREVIQLATQLVQDTGITQYRIDFCHVGIISALLAQDACASRAKDELLTYLQNKDQSRIAQLDTSICSAATRVQLLTLTRLNGGKDMIQLARQQLPALPPIRQALDELSQITAPLADDLVNIDLADLRGYDYHSGLTFAIYCHGLSNPLLRGGRYNSIGAAFGRARPATGFSVDLRALVSLQASTPTRNTICAPWYDAAVEPQLAQLIARERQRGEIVIELPETDYLAQLKNPVPLNEYEFDRIIVRDATNWSIQFLTH